MQTARGKNNYYSFSSVHPSSIVKWSSLLEALPCLHHCPPCSWRGPARHASQRAGAGGPSSPSWSGLALLSTGPAWHAEINDKANVNLKAWCCSLNTKTLNSAHFSRTTMCFYSILFKATWISYSCLVDWRSASTSASWPWSFDSSNSPLFNISAMLFLSFLAFSQALANSFSFYRTYKNK